ncbi:sarcosine oxidase subunit gamma [Phaeobacter gallaeciensis]|jgi:sarcosine oxidase subunit gamma|uniref:sarcosine oxidase subunit gamma n=1 Tax=Phaeobacter gallaeciensis TaxID=60890 RepID=UPI00237F437C|nr:sarcosine oxidase subunit gamma family protein [Phaeobacter gallaeciensis]MDE4063496.1 sarcosine oxidase subunit gamma family protein [Phaeobacter gallaeciensis]MDE4126519.1 sarcosine oxidase subunit gamma family protein [Phaeobacter gallaeciensis]MDE4130962.1 sarcosine oxidase subunit gamma family protein [Phaeobacter gallaeciensis]
MNAPVTSFDAVTVTDVPPVARFNLRIAPADLAVASKAFGLTLPTRIGQGAQKADRAAWCIGPDEWLLHASEADQQAIVAAFDKVRAKTPHSLVVISDRELTIGISGPAALVLLNTGCPLDLSRIPVGGAKRTIFDYAQVTLIRDGEDAFRLEVWRSYYPHVRGLLDIATRELAIGL